MNSEAVTTQSDNATLGYDKRYWVLFVLCFSLVVITLDNTILNVAIPTLTRELHATNSQLQWMVDAYTLLFAGLLLTAGSLGDRFGRRGALQTGLLIFGIGSASSAMVHSPTQLILTRALMGIGGAFIMPSTLSILTNVFPSSERAKAIGVWAGVAGIGVALGPVTGGWLVEHFYWGSIFLVNVPVTIFAIIAGALIIPTSKDPSTPPLDPIGALFSITGLCALVYAIIEAPNRGWLSQGTMIWFAVAAVLLVAFFVWEDHSSHPMLNVHFFKNPRFGAASIGIASVFFALFGATFQLTQYFQFVLGYSPLQTGVRLLPFAAALLTASIISPHIVEKLGTKIVVSGGLFIVAVSLLLMTQLQTDSHYLVIMAYLMIMAIGMGCTMPPATESIMGSLPLAKAGVGSAMNDTTRMVGGSLGVAVIGSVMASLYTSKIAQAFGGLGISKQALVDAQKSLGAALVLAAHAPSSSAQHHFSEVAKNAFIGGFHKGLIVGAASALLGAAVTALWLPARTNNL